jgi:hypothetical protein
LLKIDGRTVSVKVEQGWKLQIDQGKDIGTRMDTTVRGPRGTRKAEPLIGRFALDEQGPIASRGGGQALFTFEDGTLTFVRTMKSGAFRVAYTIARSEKGLICTATAQYAKERGAPVRFTSPFGDEVTVIDWKPGAATCRVTKS